MIIRKLATWWKDLSVSKKLYIVVGVMAVLIAIELLTLKLTMDVLSAVRGLVGGEALWSKSQKNSVIELQSYIVSRDEKYYQAFLQNLQVPLGDGKARVALYQMDDEGARRGFLEGRNHPDDIPQMINLIKRFNQVSYLKRSIEAWIAAESLLQELIKIGDKVHHIVSTTPKNSPIPNRETLMIEISALNTQLTILEDNFSFSLGEASRWVERTLLLALLSLVLFVESTGLFLTFKFSRSLTISLQELNEGAQRIGQGDFNHQIKVRSKDELGQLASALNQMTDELKEKTGEKNQAEEANQVKSLFLANMSHEIRTPLGAILGFVELLKDPDLSEQEKLQYHKIISRTGDTLVKIINDILDISKVEAGKIEINKEYFSLSQLLDDLHTLLKLRTDNKGIQLVLVPNSKVPDMIYSDSMRIRQILLNIMGNAIKFTDKGMVKLSYWIEDDFLYFSVKDTGKGINPSQVTHLFKAFSQGDPSIRKTHEGTGLGLTLSRKLAQLLGGDVTLAQSFFGQGSTFNICIKLERPEQESTQLAKTKNRPQPESEINPTQLTGKTILLVEDSLDNQLLFSHILSKAGAKVETANNGFEGYQAAKEKEFDLILMDMQMPILDGYEATRNLRDDGYSKAIIGLTAHALKEDLKKCLDVGCNDVITKPIKIEEFLQQLKTYF
jgi:signal transduction histidine kinase/CheY-like chemotaxis protein